MPAIAYFIIILLQGILWVLNTAMFVRAVLSWFPGDDETTLEKFLRIITEPVIMPIRTIFERFGWFQGLPIDISFFVTFILLSVLSVIVESML
ncbi:MAG: YggT family protein [Clostridia bacterium]|nr:YggT family protein [Clostridia bacterium]